MIKHALVILGGIWHDFEGYFESITTQLKPFGMGHHENL